jgi:DhnA family fructose-bisphosphate aldolase class Ia
VLRSDVANVYGPTLPRHLFSELVERAAERAVVVDAACICVNLLALPGEPEFLRQCIQNVARLRAACDDVGMPLMVEPLVMRPGEIGHGVDGDPDKIVPLVRQAVELGADVIKADPTDDLGDYPRVIEAAAPRPVLVRGGGRVSDKILLARTEAVMACGAAGIVYGRNVIQHPEPTEITRALMAIVHRA